MNEIHRIDLPRLVIVGKGVVGHLGDICSELDLKRALVVTGFTTRKIAGERVRSILSENLPAVDIALVSEADTSTVESVKNKSKDMTADVLVGVGGGRTIDVAKLGAFEAKIPFISVPTTASHDGIASSLASIKDLGRPYSMKANVPVAVVADSDVIAESPYRFTASGCGDVISKAVSVMDWKLSHEVNGEYYGDYAASLSLMSSSLVCRNAQQIRDRRESGFRTLLEALVSCGVAMSIAGSSRPCSGSEHLFSHALDLIAPMTALHGEQCGVGTIMMAKLHGLDWTSIADNLSLIGAPTSAEGLGIDPRDIIKALVRAREVRPDRYTILSEISLNEESAEKLASDCRVI